MSRVGVDTGGTFTDVVALGRNGELRTFKLPSRPQDPAAAILEGLRVVAGAEPVDELVHSTTVATNAILERSGGPTVLVTTSGFEDVLAIGRQARPQLYALHPVPIPPLLDETHRLGVVERLGPDGEVETPLDEASLAAVVARVRALGPRSAAVCLLHAYLDGRHERRVAEALTALGIPVSCSSEVLPVMREYERTSTTVADAYVVPVVAPYLERLQAARAIGRLRVTTSAGGTTAAVEAMRRPVRTLLSGPAAGVIGARAVAVAAGFPEAITLDMGGTSTDVALIVAGELERRDEGAVAGVPIQLPMLAVHTVGAGGGSIARLDPGGALKVGPESVGADPGPAAYGRGGELPTVTDADLLLGRLDPTRFLGGRMRLDLERARSVLATLGTAYGRSELQAAEDIVAVADAVMARAVRTLSVERGRDPREAVLLPFGGAGAMHAAAVARELGMRRVLVPPVPGLLSAYGSLIADVSYDLVESVLADPVTLGDRELEARFARLEAQATAALDAEQVPSQRRALERSCALRYRGQSFELVVPAGGDLAAAFHAAHRTRYGHSLLDHPVELVTVRLRAIGRAEPAPLPVDTAEAGEPVVGRASLWFAGKAREGEILLRRRLRPGARLRGPAVVVEDTATTVLPPDAEAEVLTGGALLLTLGG